MDKKVKTPLQDFQQWMQQLLPDPYQQTGIKPSSLLSKASNKSCLTRQRAEIRKAIKAKNPKLSFGVLNTGGERGSDAFILIPVNTSVSIYYLS
ncbi:hypothetical protein [Flavobacterium sp. PL02]|uniref:hypothetical protein n=1 Tax=Flavobacterium sp. PL02 TaxID=3088354 RepID=UPI002B239BC4|nr:hypothetical protein [Flavobacterium sp. PL02]MEA9414350.1 hypothetical protein [Flavobacterium sp. PL02]